MTPRWAAAAVLAGLAITALAGCAQPAPPGLPDPWPGEATFIATSVTENGAPKTLVEGTRIELRFAADGQVSANAGCNHMSGPGRIQDGKLVVTSLAMTEMGCPGTGRHEQDGWVADFLTASPAIALSGDREELTLRTATATMALTDRRIVDPDRPLVGTQWTVDTIFHGEVASSVPSDVPAVLVIDAAGTFTASTGCAGGEISGQATPVGVSTGHITFTVTGEQPCTGAGNGLDEAVRATLTGVVEFEITARSLRLLGPDDNGLGLQAPN